MNNPQQHVVLEEEIERELSEIIAQEADASTFGESLETELEWFLENDVEEIRQVYQDHIIQENQNLDSSNRADIEDSYRRPDDLSEDRPPRANTKIDSPEEIHSIDYSKGDDDYKPGQGPQGGSKKIKKKTRKEYIQESVNRILSIAEDEERIRRKLETLRGTDRTTRLAIEKSIQELFKTAAFSDTIRKNLESALRTPERNAVVLRTFDQKLKKELSKQVDLLGQYSPPRNGQTIVSEEIQNFIQDYRDGVVEYAGMLNRIRSNLGQRVLPNYTNLFQRRYAAMYANWLSLQMRFAWFQDIRNAQIASRQQSVNAYMVSGSLIGRAESAIIRAARRPTPMTITVAVGFVMVLGAVAK